MPYKSDRQRRYMHAKLPELAAKWDAEYGGKVGGGERAARRNAIKNMRKHGKTSDAKK